VKHFTHPGTSWLSAIWYALRMNASLVASLAPCDCSLLSTGLVDVVASTMQLLVHLYADERQENFCTSQWRCFAIGEILDNKGRE